MRLVYFLLLLIVFCMAGAAAAQPRPGIAAAPDWVKTVGMPAADPREADKPFQILLLSFQTRHVAEGSQAYFEAATLIQNPQGLAAGNVTIAWQPEQADLVVHKVQIIRAGKTEDVLKGGEGFTVVRRETNLESAMLDGALTAVLQPEGLSVGDVVHVAWSFRLKPGAVAFKPESLLAQLPGFRIGRALYRETWDNKLGLRWQGSGAFAKPSVRTVDGITEAVLDLRNAEPQAPPEDAPARFTAPAMLQVSGYRSWQEVSALLAPLYGKARTLETGSPIKAEVDRIAAAHTEPGRRAAAALRLVQDRVRYLALAIGEAGYVPASADQTWSRKFGDCKGKTALLLALLEGLGIEAEPVLVSTTMGDALGDRLPMARGFDHVIVRAAINGRSYYLDGTRTGDRDVEPLASSYLGYGLPLRTSGANLEKLPVLPLAEPLAETDLTYDASGGFSLPVPVSGRAVYRGEVAVAWRQALAQFGEKEVKKALAGQLPALDADDVELALEPEDAGGNLVLRISGKKRMNWIEGGPEKRRRFAFDRSTLEWAPDFKREQGAGANVPFALDHPLDLSLHETIILPQGGVGFTVQGGDIDVILAGTHFRRQTSLAGGRAVSLSRFRRVATEIPAAEAAAAVERIGALDDDRAYVAAPAEYQASKEERTAILQSAPVEATDFLERGFHRMGTGKVKDALADFDRAVALSPKWPRAHANRGVALVHLKRYAEAEEALNRASASTETDFVVHQGLGLLRLHQRRHEEAAAAFGKSLELDPKNVFTLRHRSIALRELGRDREALDDTQKVIAIEPENEWALVHAALLHTALGESDAAIAAVDRIKSEEGRNPALRLRALILNSLGRTAEADATNAAVLAQLDGELKNKPNDPGFAAEKAYTLSDLRRHSEAVAVLDAALARYAGSTTLLIARCYARIAANAQLPLARKDCDAALANDPGDIRALYHRSLLALRQQRWDAAIADCGEALRLQEAEPGCRYARGLARRARGEKEGAEQDLLRARRTDALVESGFRRIGLGGFPEDGKAAPAQ